MPKSRIRRKASYTPPVKPERKALIPLPDAWVAPLMVTLFLIGLIWIVAYYLLQRDLPLVGDWGNWNLAAGFGFIVAGFILSTRWK